MNKLLLGRYFPGDSILHQLDSRTKLLSGIIFIIFTIIANNWQSYVLLSIFTFLLMNLSKVKIRVYFQGVKPLIWLILFTVTLQVLFTAGGTIYVEWGPFTISQFGIINGFYIFCRFVLIILISTIITLTTTPVDMTDAIYVFMKPFQVFKIPVEELSLMLAISYRFIPTLLDETQKIMDAQRSRGSQIGEGNLFHQMKALVPIFLPIFANTLHRAEEMADIMDVRNYQQNEPRSKFRQLHWEVKDTVALVLMLLLMLILVLIRK